MATLAISAEFPLGVYTGHGADGAAEKVPAISRLFSALIQAAAVGSLSTGDARSPFTPGALEVLEWLEEHPPSAMAVPTVVPVSAGGRTYTYRKEGVFLKEVGRVNNKVTARTMSEGFALGGPVLWIWEDVEAGSGMIRTLDTLCADVPHLGETSSPVRLRVHTGDTVGEPTHRLDDAAGLRQHAGELRQVMPTRGRLAELEAAHAAQYRGKPPSVAADKHTTSTRPHAPRPDETCQRTGVFRPVDTLDADVPWSHVLALPIASQSRPVPEERFVSVCVALHRAIVARMGAGAPPEVTGRYAPSMPPAANRVALHYVPGDVDGLPFDDSHDRFLLMVPRGMSGHALGALVGALTGLRRVVTKAHQLAVEPDKVEVFAGDAFWRAPRPGYTRAWEAMPAVVAERRLQSVVGIRDVDLAAAWSLGNVFRELYPETGDTQAAARYAAVTDLGVRLSGRALRTLTPSAYVHKTNRASLPQPYRLTVDMGSLVSDRSIVALGQSRHLGCGLLVPRDVPTMMQEDA